MSRTDKLIYVTPEEDAAITAAAMDDPDTILPTDEELAQFKPWAEYEKLEEQLLHWCDREVVDAYTRTGHEWQRHINGALREWAERNGLLAKS
ncbi:hypothetical protein [Rugamonas sp.]|uniref:hypothetical protein n=1 Tax=Rugamonas sp. TaxID=1926287 RepID=UPI0025DF82D0|nr:hypothetical protein [Rugamonas sp.]